MSWELEGFARPCVPRKTLCAPWEAVTSLEALLEYHVQEEERKRAE